MKRDNILNLDAEGRYNYFIRKVVDFEKIWSLNSDGWVQVSSKESICFPVWPEKEFSDICAVDSWINYKSKPISLEKFLQEWIPGLQVDNLKIAVFPTPKNKGIIVDIEKLRRDLLHELENYQ